MDEPLMDPALRGETAGVPLETAAPAETIVLTEVEEAVEETRTVADDILVEVKACLEKQNQLMAALENLQGSQLLERAVEIRTELTNLREEIRTLKSELSQARRLQLSEELRSLTQPGPGSPSEVNPAVEVGPLGSGAPKKYRRI